MFIPQRNPRQKETEAILKKFKYSLGVPKVLVRMFFYSTLKSLIKAQYYYGNDFY